MKTLKFNTNIKCDACVAKVTNALNNVAGEKNWEVNLQAPERTLIVTSEAKSPDVINALKQVGYEAEEVK